VEDSSAKSAGLTAQRRGWARGGVARSGIAESGDGAAVETARRGSGESASGGRGLLSQLPEGRKSSDLTAH
jgi:hypothetical protein